MKRKLTILSFAAFAALAMSAVMASAASAAESHHFTSDVEVTHLTAEGISETQNFWPTTVDKANDDNKVSCKDVNVDGTIESKTKEVTEVTVTPTYSNCQAFQGESELHATVTHNGCHFLFTGDTTETKTPEQEHAAVHIHDCATETGIEIHVTIFNLECIDIPEQTVHGIKYTENGNHIDIKATVHGLKSVTTGACGEEVHEDGVYTGEVTVSGYSDTEHKNEANLGLKTTTE